MVFLLFAAGLGLEPRYADSESAVLPLDDPARVAFEFEGPCRIAENELNFKQKGRTVKPAKLPAIPSDEEAAALLKRHGIDIRAWDGVRTKTLGELMHSIKLGEAWLEPNGSELRINFNVATVNVMIARDGSWFELFEARQILADGSEKIRRFPFSIAEKIMVLRETPIQAARRGLKEELQLKPDSGYSLTRKGFKIFRNGSSDWYPGLRDLYHWHCHWCFITEELFRPSYMERCLHKTIHFEWREVADRELLANLPAPAAA